MNILLTGATGFVGSWILTKLLENGHNVTISIREDSNFERISDSLDQVNSINITNGINNKIELDCIIHAATAYEKGNYAGSTILSANIDLPIYLLDYAVNNGCKSFINISTFVAKYKQYPPNRYSLTKKHFEEWGKYYSSHYDINFKNIVLHQVYGEGDSINKFTPWLINELNKNVSSIDLTEGDQQRDFVNVIDVADAVLLILKKEISYNYEEFEVCTGITTTVKEFAELAKKITHAHTSLNFGSINYRVNELMIINPDSSSLQKLGWKPKINLEKGIKNIALKTSLI